MDVMEKCEDPNNYDIFGFNVTYPNTNLYFPPGMNLYIDLQKSPQKAIKSLIIIITGAVCARTLYTPVCFFAGESGSPLMLK